jgi:hypothetical protein
VKPSYFRIAITIAFLFLCSGCKPDPSTYSSKDKVLLLGLTLDKQTYTADETILATLTIKNVSTQSVWVNKRMAIDYKWTLEGDGEVYFVVLNPSGGELGFGFDINRNQAMSSDYVEMHPGDILTQTYDLEEYYIGRGSGVETGTYSVQGAYHNAYQPALGYPVWKGEILSNVVKFTISHER